MTGALRRFMFGSYFLVDDDPSVSPKFKILEGRILSTQFVLPEYHFIPIFQFFTCWSVAFCLEQCWVGYWKSRNFLVLVVYLERPYSTWSWKICNSTVHLFHSSPFSIILVIYLVSFSTSIGYGIGIVPAYKPQLLCVGRD